MYNLPEIWTLHRTINQQTSDRLRQRHLDTGILTRANISNLVIGMLVYHTTKRNADGSAMRAKVTSIKTWKRTPSRVEVHLKHGVYDFATFDETDIHNLTTIEPLYPSKADENKLIRAIVRELKSMTYDFPTLCITAESLAVKCNVHTSDVRPYVRTAIQQYQKGN